MFFDTLIDIYSAKGVNMGWTSTGNFPKELTTKVCPFKEGEICIGKITNLNASFRYGHISVGNHPVNLIFVFSAIDGWPGSSKGDTLKKIDEKLKRLDRFGGNGIEINMNVRVEIGRNWTAKRIFPI